MDWKNLPLEEKVKYARQTLSLFYFPYCSKTEKLHLCYCMGLIDGYEKIRLDK